MVEFYRDRPGLRYHLPSQQEVIEFMKASRLFFGSFYNFEWGGIQIFRV